MGAHLIDGEFQSDKYPTCPRGKVPLSVRDPAAQDLLWEYAQRHRAIDPEFSTDLEEALRRAGYAPPRQGLTLVEALRESKASGTRYMRPSGGGWYRYHEGWVYKIPVEDLIADDWETIATAIPKITGGAWEPVEP